MWDPSRGEAGEVVFVITRGFPFGLTSAVYHFNRYPRMVCEAMHALYAWCGTSYYDDFCTVEPTWAAASGQLYLCRFAERLGIPFSDAKHVDMAPTFVFLGVEARLGGFWPEGVVTLGVEDERCCRIADTIDYHLDGGSLFCG